MRKVICLNNDWRFVHRSDCDPAVMPEDGEHVCLPHSWNEVDGHDGHAIHIPVKDWSQGDLSGAPKDGMTAAPTGTTGPSTAFPSPSTADGCTWKSGGRAGRHGLRQRTEGCVS